jgi:hypothetical protein
MKYLLKFVLIGTILIVSSGKLTNDEKISGIEGTYKSNVPSMWDHLSIMYLRGNFNFLYKRPSDEILKIANDSTFSHIKKTGNDSIIENTGYWKIVNKQNILLNYNDLNMTPLELKLKSHKMYHIKEVTLCDSGKKIKFLTLLKKV